MNLFHAPSFHRVPVESHRLKALSRPLSAHRKLVGLSLGQRLEVLREAFVQEAQEIYYGWIQDEEDLHGNGGICDEIANALLGVITEHDVPAEVTDGGQEGDDHAFLIVFDAHEAYVVDIPYGLYERGGGYSWTKIQGVVFEPRDVVIERLDDASARRLWADRERP